MVPEGLFTRIFYIPYEERLLDFEPDVAPLLELDSPMIDGIKELSTVIERYGLGEER